MNQNIITYKCHYIENDFEIGGDFNNPIWEKAEPIDFWVPVTDAVPISKTEAGLLWSKNYIYVFMKAYDKDIYAYNTKRDSPTCDDDVLEFFCRPTLENEIYYNFEINPLNTVYDARSIKKDFAGGEWRWQHWNCEGLKSAVEIKGTLNNPFDVDEYWRLEMAVPISELDSSGKKTIDFGDEWTFLLSRYDFSVYLPGNGLELSSTCHLPREKYFDYEHWNKLAFVK